MAKVEVFFLHGFLGEPYDWSEAMEHLENRSKMTIHAPDLVDFFDQCQESQSLAKAATRFAMEHFKADSRKLVVGYSMGGRLSMHLPLDNETRLLLLAAHPGLNEGLDERLKADQAWIEKTKQLSKAQWLSQWNQQEVFKQDRRRPGRDLADNRFSVFQKILSAWSLGKQQAQWDKLKSNGERIWWAHGEDDQKFKEIGEQIKNNLPDLHVRSIANAGHGVIFDNAKGVAQLVDEVAGDWL